MFARFLTSWWVLLIGLFAVGAIGCSGLPRRLVPPAVSVAGVQLLKQTDEGASVQVSVVLVNPNRVPLPIVTNSYTVTVGDFPQGRSFAFTDKPRRTLPAKGSQTIDLIAAFDTGGAAVTGLRYRVSGSVAYEPPGQIRRLLTESGIPLPSVGYSSSGKLQ